MEHFYFSFSWGDMIDLRYIERFISYRKYKLQITQPSQYRCTQLQYRFAVISDAPSICPWEKCDPVPDYQC